MGDSSTVGDGLQFRSGLPGDMANNQVILCHVPQWLIHSDLSSNKDLVEEHREQTIGQFMLGAV